MRRRTTKHVIRHKAMRAVLSEFLPYELPAGFSNARLYAFLLRHGAHFEGRDLIVRSDSSDVDAILRLLLGLRVQPVPISRNTETWLRIPTKQLEAKSVPYRFRIRHGTMDFRELAIPHPRTQLALVKFYDEFKSLITHFGQESPYSIRKPVEEVRVTVTRDDLFKAREGRFRSPVETVGHEYARLRSFFRYESFSNIHEFYDSPEYQESEKQFANLLRLDVARCFDSIYSHTIEWAIYGRDNVKSNRNAYKDTFPNRFDKLVTAMNEDETNGILIGPEVSRVFAELILQRIDRDIKSSLETVGLGVGSQYVAFRYVDDFFFFYNSPNHQEVIQQAVVDALQPYKLSVQQSKVENSLTPHLTPLSLAKVEVRRIVGERLWAQRPGVGENEQGQNLIATERASDLVNAYKTVLAITGVQPKDLANYALVQIEERLEEALVVFRLARVSALEDAESASVEASTAKLLAAAVQFAFYVYSGSGLASAGVKVTRIAALALKAAEVLMGSTDRREHVRQIIYSEVALQMTKHPMSSSSTVEGLYLLDLLGELGEDYGLPRTRLVEFLGFSSALDGSIKIPSWFHTVAATTVLRYIRQRATYSALHNALETWMLSRIKFFIDEQDDHAERAVLVLDGLSSPYVSDTTKREILRLHKLPGSPAALKRIGALADQWFTDWDRSDLYSDLMDKRSQDVY